MKKKILTLLLCFMLLSCSLLFCGCFGQKQILGVWWWKDSLGDEYLDFAKSNGVTEIYYCTGKLNDDTDAFIAKAKKKGISVYWLTGEYQWVEKYASVKKQVDRYVEYQNTHKNKFEGIHFDIEPQQDKAQWKADKIGLLKKYIQMTYDLKREYPNIWLEYDIQMSWEDEVEFNGKTKPIFAHVMDNASRVTIMSYRDTAEKIYKVAEAEIEYAKANKKLLNLGVETYSTEGNQVSFAEEGKEYMYQELAKLRKMIPNKFGIVIHQIKQWYDLKD